MHYALVEKKTVKVVRLTYDFSDRKSTDKTGPGSLNLKS